jgi:hypothetical protein
MHNSQSDGIIKILIIATACDTCYHGSALCTLYLRPFYRGFRSEWTDRIPRFQFCQATKNGFVIFLLVVEFVSAIRAATFSLLALP